MESGLAFREYNNLNNLKFDDEKVSTVTSRQQQKTETAIEKCFQRFHQLRFLDPKVTKFYRADHQRYLENMLRHLPMNYECLDCSRTWNVYWILQAAHTLNFTFSDETLQHVVEFLIKCRDVDGGFAGGPGQYPHLATTYAAVNSLCIIGTPKAYNAIDRASLLNFLFSLREPDGSFQMHVGGETDIRGAYCAISCAKLVNTPEEIFSKLFENASDWISSCQTYEGGMGGTPHLEAHGGYTFCGVAALALLNEGHKCDRKQLLKWSLQRQMAFEGGFQGRTNKLVDGCYSFWVGASIPITQALMANETYHSKHRLFDSVALQQYILLCCQQSKGGLIDKPNQPHDLYHTCYALSGVAIAQHAESMLEPEVLGDPENELLPTHPLFNIPPKSVAASLKYFDSINNLNKKLHYGNADESFNTSPTEGNGMEKDEQMESVDEEAVSSASSSISNRSANNII